MSGSGDQATADTSAQHERRLSDAEQAFYGSDAELVIPESPEELGEIVRDCTQRRRCLIPAGLGTHAHIGNLCPAQPLVASLARLDSIVCYEPADFTVGVEAGTPLDVLRATLAENGQELPIDLGMDRPASRAGTIGGVVAIDAGGPRRGRLGSFRNAIIGVVGTRGDGTVYKAGGMVVKNVAGYDIGKLFVGSLGTLGPLLRINFKLRPLPTARAAGAVTFAQVGPAWKLVAAFRRAYLEAMALVVLDPAATASLGKAAELDLGGWSVNWLFEGNDGAVASLEKTVAAILDTPDEFPAEARATLDAEQSRSVQEWLTGFQDPPEPTAKNLVIVRLSVLPTHLERLHDAVRQILQTNGLEGEFLGDALTGLAVLRATGGEDAIRSSLAASVDALGSLGGTGRMVFASPELRRSHDYLLIPDPNRELAKRIQRVFDPAGIFSPGKVSPE